MLAIGGMKSTKTIGGSPTLYTFYGIVFLKNKKKERIEYFTLRRGRVEKYELMILSFEILRTQEQYKELLLLSSSKKRMTNFHHHCCETA
jgi:hypothetical protein